MPFSMPPTAVDATEIASAHVNTLRDNDNWFDGLLSSPSGAGQVPISSSTSAAAWGYLAAAQIADGAATTAKIGAGEIGADQIAAGNITTGVLDSAVAAMLMPAGLCAWFGTAAEIPSGWARETVADGRLLVGAGTTYSQTFTEETDYGSSWSHTHTLPTQSSYDNYTTVDLRASLFEISAAHPGHGHTLSGSTTSSAWTIPVRGYVAARKS